jgi:polysaccharide biosynthesis/export protein
MWMNLSAFRSNASPVVLLILSMVCWVGLGHPAARGAESESEYRIGPNDIIRVQVFGEDDLSVERKVGGDGQINFPLLGNVAVHGRTIQALQDELAARLGDGYVRQPKVIVYIVRYRNFYVSGEVRTPGGYAYEGGLTVRKAISLAGGFTEKADRHVIKVLRGGQGIADAQPIAQDGLILPDDTIMVAQIRKFYVTGEVGRAGGYTYEDGLTVQMAISLAGGMTEKAEKGDIKLTRVASGVAETLRAEPDLLVLPDDIIAVEPQTHKFYAGGEVKTAGSFPHKEGLTVHKAIAMAGGVTEKAEKGNIKLTRVASGVAETLRAEPDLLVLPDDIITVEPQTHKFYTSGEVKTPGSFPYKESLTVHKAIALAGGLTEKAERGEFQVLRQVQGQEERLPVKWDSLMQPDDILVVAEGQRFYVSGEVKTPGRYLYEKGLTVHKAISMAGGLTEKAEKRDIKVRRVLGDHIDVTATELDGAVSPDDFIVVERVQRIYIDGEVKKPGDYSYEKGITVHKAITMAGGFTDKASESRTKVLRMVNGEEQSLAVKLDDPVLPEDIVVVPKRFF